MISIVFLALVLLSSGCSVHQAWTGHKKPGLSYISIDKHGNIVSNNKAIALLEELMQIEKESGPEELAKFLSDNANRSTLFIWSAEYNGAMINGKGNACLQAATFARSTDVNTEISSSLLSLLGNINVSSSASAEDKLLAVTVTEAITKLGASSEQSTYLSAGLFGLCILEANEGLTPQQVEKAILKLIESSSLSAADSKNDVGKTQ